MQITIIGVGAMGSLFAGRLSQLADITMLGSWVAQIETLNADGIILIHPDGRKTRHLIKATNNLKTIKSADLVLILVKTPHTAVAARQAAGILDPNGLVITLQNGIGNLETIAQIVGPTRAAQGVTSEGAAIVKSGVVRHAGAEKTYLAESMFGTGTSDTGRANRLKKVVKLFNEAGFETELVKNADSLIWGKLAVNAGINPLTALLQVPNGFLTENDDANWLMRQTAAEAAAVAQALGIELPYLDAAERAEAVARATAANHSSMAQDVARGVRTEIESICGAVVAHGQKVGIQTPLNQVMLALIQSLTKTGQWVETLQAQPPTIRQRFMQLTEKESTT